MTIVTKVNGRPYFRYSINDITFPFFLLILAATTFAEAPIKVAFPPRHAPSERLHQRASTFGNAVCRFFISGSIVVVYGILSIIGETELDNIPMNKAVF